MFVCQWHLDVPYGKQAEALAVMRAWGAEKFAEAALAGMSAPQFKPHSDALAPFIVPASQRWVVYRVLAERPR
ncbi:MAG: hypothetical protein H0T86_08685 [Gemmatimonadales bacterium]|nr:hypothetical protein [Gemmatimonadales bacterium]